MPNEATADDTHNTRIASIGKCSISSSGISWEPPEALITAFPHVRYLEMEYDPAYGSPEECYARMLDTVDLLQASAAAITSDVKRMGVELYHENYADQMHDFELADLKGPDGQVSDEILSNGIDIVGLWIGHDHDSVAYAALQCDCPFDSEHGIPYTLKEGRLTVGDEPPETSLAEEEELLERHLECERRYLDLASRVTNISSAKDLAANIVEVQAVSQELYNQTCRLPSSTMSRELSEVVGKRLAEFERIWTNCPEAAQYLSQHLANCPAWTNIGRQFRS